MTVIVSPSNRRKRELEKTRKTFGVVTIITILVLLVPLSVFLLSSGHNSSSNSIPSNKDGVVEPNTIENNHPDYELDIKLEHKVAVKKQRKLRKRRLLPTFDNGGVIIYFHIAKTGGSSIRNFIMEHQQSQQKSDNDVDGLPTIRYERMWNPETSLYLEREILNQLTKVNTSSDILFVEISGDVPGFVYWQRKLNRFREIVQNKRSFFSFTVLREPISFHTSYYNTYKVAPCHEVNDEEDKLCEEPLVEPSDVTEQSLLDNSIPNHQCLWLARLSHNPYRQESCVTNDECRGTYSYMKDHLDWIGTTEQVNSVTIPLLAYLVTGSNAPKAAELASAVEPYAVASHVDKDGQLNTDSLSKSTISTLLDRSAGDSDVYNSIKQDYDIYNNLYDNYNPTKLNPSES